MELSCTSVNLILKSTNTDKITLLMQLTENVMKKFSQYQRSLKLHGIHQIKMAKLDLQNLKYIIYCSSH